MKKILLVCAIALLFSCQWEYQKKNLTFFVGKWHTETIGYQVDIIFNKEGGGKFIYIYHGDTDSDTCSASISWILNYKPNSEYIGKIASLNIKKYDNLKCTTEVPTNAVVDETVQYFFEKLFENKEQPNVIVIRKLDENQIGIGNLAFISSPDNIK